MEDHGPQNSGKICLESKIDILREVIRTMKVSPTDINLIFINGVISE